MSRRRLIPCRLGAASEYLPVIAVDYRKPREAGLGHPQHHSPQRLIGMSHNRFSQRIRHDVSAAGHSVSSRKLLAGYHALQAFSRSTTG
jgi:hypothetical protein